MKTVEQKLKDTLKKLRKEHGSDEIFKVLTSICNESSDDYLTDEVISWLNIYKGLNVVKVDGLDKQIQFEETLQTIYPYYNEQQQNLFLIN